MAEAFVAQNPDCVQPTHPAQIRLKSDSSRPTNLLCNAAKSPLACAFRSNGGADCTILTLPEDQLIARGVPLNVNMRHEIGHRNGWSGWHHDARDWVKGDNTPWRWETPPLSSPSANDTQPPAARVRGSNGDYTTTPPPPPWWQSPQAPDTSRWWARVPVPSTGKPQPVSVCLAVIDPPAEATKDREFKADSWLILREAPDTKSKAVVKLGNQEKLEADEIRDDWTHVSNVIRLSEADAPPNQKLVQGWVRSKYLVERQCYDDPTNRSK
jgi:hypothetical protein